jgi:glycosyltransferase involved in cell wall biosynthesis
VDAARRLAGSIFPSVQKQFPELKLFIVGENPPADLKRMSGEKVIVTGRVPDLTPYLDRAALLVAPVQLGGGMRIKVLESLAAGKAIVTTPLAAEGLDIVDGEQLAIAETDVQFTERIVHLLQHPEERLALAGRARTWACEHTAWDKSISKYEILYEELLGGSRQSGTHNKSSVNHGEIKDDAEYSLLRLRNS